MICRTTTIVLLLLASTAWSQGQDSTPSERDLQVLVTMLPGGYDNANQSYFDTRVDREIKHRRRHVEVARLDAPAIGADVFLASSYWDNEIDQSAGYWLLALSADGANDAVRMQSWAVDTPPDATQLNNSGAFPDSSSCDFLWRREAEQFRASALTRCDADALHEMVLGAREMWMTFGSGAADEYKMHRVRNFECYADIPGVGGGRNEDYERYEDFRIHDRGGAVWFDSKDGRRLGISLFLVDWPVNNYVGVFARDSFVIYITEEIDGVSKEHGYAFTVPEADRIGINLKWMLASCFMKSNKFATPSM